MRKESYLFIIGNYKTLEIRTVNVSRKFYMTAFSRNVFEIDRRHVELISQRT